MKNVLVVAYYFPPAGGSGVQRVAKFVKYLRGFGWEPVVLTVREGAYPETDETLLDDIPDDVRVVRTDSWDPYRWYARLTGKSERAAVKIGSMDMTDPGWKERLSVWLRANVFLPDARVGWVPYGIRAGLKLLRSEPFDAILTSGPPHSLHLIGRALHRKTGVPWVADFRDPWTDINYYEQLPHTAWARRRDAALERSVLREADGVCTVSSECRRLLEEKVPARTAERPVRVVFNGFDVADLESADPRADDRFTLTHVGVLYDTRNPEALWEALARLRAAGEIPELRVRLVGRVADSIRAAWTAHGLDEIVETVGYVPHEEAVGEMLGADVLLLSIESVPGAEGMMTGKIFEYVATGRPVLAVGPVGGDADRFLADLDAGALFDPADADGIADYLRAAYTAWDADRATGRPRLDPRTLPYSREGQTARLAALLDAVAAPDG